MKYKYLVAYLFLIVLVTLGSYTLAKLTHKKTNHPLSTQSPTNQSESPKSKDSYTVALVGYGGGNHDGGGLADTIILLNINTSTKKIKVTTIPRDTFISGQKINSIFATQGANGLKTAAKTITGIEVDYLVSINFDSFSSLIDSLGGLNVNVPVAFEDKFYPVKGLENETCGKTPEEIVQIHEAYSGYQLEQQFTCRYEDLIFNQGMQEMDGATALKFVRSRHSSQHGGDFARSERQYSLLLALKDKLLTKDLLANPEATFEKIKGFVTSDIDLSVAEGLLKLIGDPNNYELLKINLNTQNVFIESKTPQGSYILIPKAGEGNWGPTQDFVKN